MQNLQITPTNTVIIVRNIQFSIDNTISNEILSPIQQPLTQKLEQGHLTSGSHQVELCNVFLSYSNKNSAPRPGHSYHILTTQRLDIQGCFPTQLKFKLEFGISGLLWTFSGSQRIGVDYCKAILVASRSLWNFPERQWMIVARCGIFLSGSGLL